MEMLLKKVEGFPDGTPVKVHIAAINTLFEIKKACHQSWHVTPSLNDQCIRQLDATRVPLETLSLKLPKDCLLWIKLWIKVFSILQSQE
jgi:hypothetical protein